MKSLHRPDLFMWSAFDVERNIDFNSLLWKRPEGNVVVDPLELSGHDQAHLTALGGVAWIVVTNSDHVRSADSLRRQTGAKLAGPAAEQASFPIACDRWLADGDELVPQLRVVALEGSKTPGELALVLQDSTLITGDLIRAHRAGALSLLPDGKLVDVGAARRSLARVAELSAVSAVLVGDGFCVFERGHQHLQALAAANLP